MSEHVALGGGRYRYYAFQGESAAASSIAAADSAVIAAARAACRDGRWDAVQAAVVALEMLEAGAASDIGGGDMGL